MNINLIIYKYNKYNVKLNKIIIKYVIMVLTSYGIVTFNVFYIKC